MSAQDKDAYCNETRPTVGISGLSFKFEQSDSVEIPSPVDGSV